jgi:hypothetical protein
MAINRSLMNRQMYFSGSSPYGDMGRGLYNTQYGLPQSMANYLNQYLPGQSSSGNAIYPRLGQLNSGVSSAEQELQQINQSIDQVQSTLGESSGQPAGTGVMDASDRRYGIPNGPGLKDIYGNPARPPSIIDNNRPPGGYPNVPALTDIFAEAQKSAQDKRAGGFMGRVVLPGEMSFGDFSNIYNAGGFQAGPLGSSPMSTAMRNMAAGGGMMGRQMYGLGSLVKKAVKGVTGAVKSFAKSDLGKAAILGIGAFGLPTAAGQSIFGGFLSPTSPLRNVATNVLFGKERGVFPGERTGGIFDIAKNFLKTPGGAFAGITAASALAAAGLDPENPNEMPRNTEALKSYLRQGYLTLNPQAQPDEVEEFVEANTVEYRANGGRIGFAEGMLSFEEAKAMNPGMFSAEVETDVVRPNTELLNYIKRIRDAVEKGIIPMDFAMDLIKQKTMEQGVDLQDLRDDIMETQRIEQAYGGRMQYGLGDLVRGSSDGLSTCT